MGEEECQRNGFFVRQAAGEFMTSLKVLVAG